METDFLGYQPGNVATTTNSSGLRLRLAFVDARKDKWEVFGGQTWSLLTPGRTGISPLPANLFLTEDLDPNLQSGMFWGRTPQFRVVFRPKARVALGMSFESGDVYAGGSGGSVSVTLPGALAPNYFGQIDTGTSVASVPSPNSDFIAKIAFDPKMSDRAMHVEVAGLVNRAAFYNPLNNQTFSAVGGGVAVNAGIEAIPHLTLYTNNFYTHGGGRFIFGEAPNLIIQGDGAPALVRATSTVDGLEFQMGPKWKLSAYYGGTFIDRAVTTDPATGSPVGYGYAGAPSGQNRSIQEVTGGFTRILWQNPNYGAFRFSGQYSWLTRRPWSVAPGQPSSTSLHMLYLTFRYVLPGAPTPKQ